MTASEPSGNAVTLPIAALKAGPKGNSLVIDILLLSSLEELEESSDAEEPEGDRDFSVGTGMWWPKLGGKDDG